MDWRKVVRGVGRTLIAAGVTILLFVLYQLFGTGLAERRSQSDLRKDLEAELAAPAPAPPTPGVTPPTTLSPAVAPPTGEAVAIIQIAKIGVTKAVVEGVGLPDLRKGPGHYPGTPLPGQPGNAAIAGHRTTYGAPFFRLDELAAGDPIIVTTRQGKYRYEVIGSKRVKPTDVSVIQPSTENHLTLTTCNPRFSAAERLVVTALLKGEAAEPPPAPTPVAAAPGQPATPPTTVADQTSELAGDSSATVPSILWGLLVLAVGIVIWLIARRLERRSWVVYVLGAPVLLAVMFVFFGNINRLLPANI